MDTITERFKTLQKNRPTIKDYSEFVDHCDTLNNNIVNYYEKLTVMIESQNLTQEHIDKHDEQLNLLYGNSIILLGYMGITEEEIDGTVDKYVTSIGLSDSLHYMERGFIFERLKRVAIKELISFGLIPNPNYQKFFSNRTVYYSDAYRAWLKGEILDVFTNIQYIRQQIFQDKDQDLLGFAFGLLVTINILITTTETKVNIPWSDI